MTCYNWDKILKQKSDSELNDIIKGRSHLPGIVMELAKKEKDRREKKF
jgi:hypothetical protein